MRIAIIIALTILSGVGDANGFVHAGRIWSSGSIDTAELGKSAIGFGGGVLCYWALVRFASAAGIVSSEVQVLGWFVVTLTSVAVISRSFFAWTAPDRVLALVIAVALAMLIYRTEAA